jgi:transposase InsO family protein
MCAEANIKMVHGKPYTPRTQGKVERMNGTLQRLINKHMIENNTNNWIKELPRLVLHINNVPNATTGTS